MFMKMVFFDFIIGNVIFFMFNDRIFAKIGMFENSVVDFLFRYLIFLFFFMEYFLYFFMGFLILMFMFGFVFKILNDGRSRFFFNNVSIISFNICIWGFLMSCYGMDGVVV